ncbi:MAG: ribosome biogenesis GTP-binding protein YihA/YsxC [Candidatus Krumholzibacteriia bacterium]
MLASFVTSAASLADRPQPPLAEFAFVGRSNCGKSSLINYFLGRSKLALTSRQPGKTRLLNYFLVDERYYLVDLPGYGYAKVSQAQRAAWTTLVRSYLAAGDRSLALFHLLDARHEPSVEDAEMSLWLREAGVPFAIAVTKVDKVGSTKLSAHLRRIIAALELPPGTPFIPTSATRGEGRGEMAAWIEARLAIAAASG